MVILCRTCRSLLATSLSFLTSFLNLWGCDYIEHLTINEKNDLRFLMLKIPFSVLNVHRFLPFLFIMKKNKSFKCKSTLKDMEIYKPESKRIKKQSKKSQNHYWTTAKYSLLNSLCNCLNF